MDAARAHLESLLRARKLDLTLTSSAPWREQDDPDDVAATGWAALDRSLGGGLRRGHLSEIVGPRSAGCAAVMTACMAAATARGEVMALIDTHDRFDPGTAAAAGVDLSRLLWVRETGNADRALKAANLILQAGGFGLVVFDLADVRGPALRQFPHTTWMRIARVIEGSATAAVLLAAEHVARSPGGVTIALQHADPLAGEWTGESARARRLTGLTIRPRVISARSANSPLPTPPPTRAGHARSGAAGNSHAKPFVAAG
jgi:recombination protein RecA